MKNIPYSNAIDSIMFLMVCTRPDIAYAISCLSRYMSNAGPPHWEALKWLLRYLNGSADLGIMFSKCSKGVDLTGYVDSNYANDRDSRRSTTSYIFTLCGSCITWKSQLQQIVALSTTEVEYIAATEAFKEALWVEGLVKEIGFLNKKSQSFRTCIEALDVESYPPFEEGSAVNGTDFRLEFRVEWSASEALYFVGEQTTDLGRGCQQSTRTSDGVK
ncbi:UNVERIFIED_CONTAM: Retrovirus-related Pol polyprotein from transposon TNT 1-94 [Sesamum calycinum]|uniref:Retrovirus-related Pol polyprotein from transposon TNT 1-94 n=1 Tax=Sesamum calycinum TaxID=2727403 RepID=A0AAW2KTH9_9LAMI